MEANINALQADDALSQKEAGADGYLDVAKLRSINGERWNRIWQIIKQQRPSLASHLRDPFQAECIERFGARIEIPLNQLPADALKLIPDEAVTE